MPISKKPAMASPSPAGTVTIATPTPETIKPIYPSIIHSTPKSFGEENSQAIIGIQMASAYLGATLAPPLFGIIASYLNVKLLPLYLAIFMMLSLVMLELLNKQAEEKTAEK